MSFADSDIAKIFGAGILSNFPTSSMAISVPDEAYGVSWNGSLQTPTKNAIYDKIETLSPTSSTDDLKRLVFLGI